MRVSFHQSHPGRRLELGIMASTIVRKVATSTSLRGPPSAWILGGRQGTRPFLAPAAGSSFSTATKKKKAGKTDENELSWTQTKQLAKDRRRALFDAKQERQKLLKTRRSTRRGSLKRQFNDWFIQHHKVHNEVHDRKARQLGLDWEIHVAVLLERPPVVLQDLPEWEEAMQDLQVDLGQYGKEYPDQVDKTNSQEFLLDSDELWARLPEGFVPAPRETEHDASGNVHTLDRRLKTNVYLYVQTADQEWQVPTTTLQADETLLEAAQRALAESLGTEDVQYWCPSNCPLAVQLTPYDEPQGGLYGRKTFYLKVQYEEGAIAEGATIPDYAWLDRSEITERVKEAQGETASRFYHYLL